MRISEIAAFQVPGIHSVGNISVDGKPYEVAEDGDTLIEKSISEEGLAENERTASVPA